MRVVCSLIMITIAAWQNEPSCRSTCSNCAAPSPPLGDSSPFKQVDVECANSVEGSSSAGDPPRPQVRAGALSSDVSPMRSRAVLAFCWSEGLTNTPAHTSAGYASVERIGRGTPDLHSHPPAFRRARSARVLNVGGNVQVSARDQRPQGC